MRRAFLQFVSVTRLTVLEVIRQPIGLLLISSCILFIALLPVLVTHTLGEADRLIRDSALSLTLVTGLLRRDRLLSYLRHFILFEVVGDKITKKGAKYHQFFAVQKAVEAFGAVDIVVNNSGGPPKGRFDDLDESHWELAYNRSLMSAVRLTKAALPHLRASDQGRVISITSTSIKQPIPGLLLSNSLRSALAGWSKTIADELGPDGITVNVVSPGRVDTARLAELHAAWGERDGLALDEVRVREAGKIPLGRFAEPSEIGNAAVFLASKAASYITGHVLQVDGGLIRGLL